MFIAELRVALMNEVDPEEAHTLIYGLLSAMRMNGQIWGKEWMCINDGAAISVRFLLPELAALDHGNLWVNKSLNELESNVAARLETTIIGEDPSVAVCECATPASYILYTQDQEIASVLRCGDCFRGVPLYRLPALSNDEYFELIMWESTFQALDQLDYGWLGPEETLDDPLHIAVRREIASLDSATSQSGLLLCQQLHTSSARPVYYYLPYQRTEQCPCCGEQFERVAWHDFDRVCHTCALVSTRDAT